MKKYIRQKGYKFRENYDDMTDKQFTLQSVVYENSETSTLGNKKLDRTEIYNMFLKDFDPALLKSKLESILNTALADGINVSLSNNILVEKQENGYVVIMEFLIQG